MANPFEFDQEFEEDLPEEMTTSSPVLGGVRSHSISQHLFQTHNYKRPTFCAHCGGLLVGVVRQGLRCKRCEVDVHEKCQEDLKQPCIEVIIGQHNFREKSYKQLTYCDHCSKLLVGVVNQGLKCTECGANVHEKCQELIEVTCREVKMRKTKKESRSPSLQRNRPSRKPIKKASIKVPGEKTPLRPTQQADGNDELGRDYSNMFEMMPQSSQAASHSKNQLYPSSAPSSPAHSPRQQRSKSLVPTTGDLQKEVEEITETMAENVIKLNTRGDNLENLQVNSDRLAQTSKIFQEKSNQIKQKYWLKNKRLWIGIGVAVFILIAVIIVVIVIKTQPPPPATKAPTG